MASYSLRPISPLLWAWRLRGVSPEPHGVALTKGLAKWAAERAAARAARAPKPPPRPSR